MFSKAVADRLKYYVYGLIDPRNGETFYVGKGTGNRVFAHAKNEPHEGADALTDKLKRIRAIRQVASVPKEILKRYEKWKDIARLSGPPGLRLIKGFHDEALRGKWKGYRSSRLGDQWRVIYRVIASKLLIQVASISAHDYRRA